MKNQVDKIYQLIDKNLNKVKKVHFSSTNYIFEI